MVHKIKKYYGKMSLVFPENSKNCQNHGLVEGAVMGRHVNSTREIGHDYSANYLKFVIHKKLFACRLKTFAIQVFPKTLLKKN